MDPEKDYHAVLGVEPTASTADIRSAWLGLVQQHHPDRWVGHGAERAREATSRTHQLNEAWQLLNDDRRRMEHNRLRALRLLAAVGWRPPATSRRANGGHASDLEPPERPAPDDMRDDGPSDGGLAPEGFAAPPLGDEGPPRQTPWGPRAIISVLGLALLAYVAVVIGVGAVLIGLTGDDLTSAEEIMAALVATALFDLAIIVFAYWLGLRPHRLGFRAFGFRRFGRQEARLALTGLLVSWGVLIVYGTLVQITGLDGLFPESTIPEDVFDEPSTIIAGAVVTVMVAPLAEEAFFRGFVFAGLAPRWGFWRAAAVSGTAFSIAHLDPGSLLPFMLVGMVFAWLYYRTNSLWTAVAMHFAFNLISYSVTVAMELA